MPMKIYVAHSRKDDYKNELYKPIRDSELNKVAEIILPHENDDDIFDSREELKSVDYMIAEVSYPSVAIGIEIGWADMYNVPVILLHKSDSIVSNSVRGVATEVIEYSSSEDMVKKLTDFLIK